MAKRVGSFIARIARLELYKAPVQKAIPLIACLSQLSKAFCATKKAAGKL